tara:strand:+ start:85 stop:408 length:324 start_codon:yes stop_codon:yes gene_type:complete
MSYNVPDDWGLYYDKCWECGSITHASEYYSCKCDEKEQEEYDTNLITSRHVVCSKTGQLKFVSILRDNNGGVKTLSEYWVTDDWHINRYLTPNQIKWRNNLLKRLGR